MKHSYPDELFPVVDEDGNTIGEALRSICHNGKSMLLHPVVHLHLFNSSGKLYLQKRSMSKDIQPGKWDTSVGGHVDPGESVTDALARETREELGLKKFVPVFAGRYVWKSSLERELVNSYTTVTDELPEINKDEIEEGRYWSMDEIKSNTGKGIFTPNFEHEFELLLSSPTY
jgi:isopentenyldiphosphate isomerase